MDDEQEWLIDDETLRDDRVESSARAAQDLGAPLYKMERARYIRLEQEYMQDCLALVFWRLQYLHWKPELVSRLECLRRLEMLVGCDNPQIRYEAQCDIESRLYQGKRKWL